MTTYAGYCIGGSSAGEFYESNSPTLQTTKPLLMSQFDYRPENASVLDAPLEREEYVYEHFVIDGHHVGVWVPKGDTLGTAVPLYCLFGRLLAGYVFAQTLDREMQYQPGKYLDRLNKARNRRRLSDGP